MGRVFSNAKRDAKRAVDRVARELDPTGEIIAYEHTWVDFEQSVGQVACCQVAGCNKLQSGQQVACCKVAGFDGLHTSEVRSIRTYLKGVAANCSPDKDRGRVEMSAEWMLVRIFNQGRPMIRLRAKTKLAKTGVCKVQKANGSWVIVQLLIPTCPTSVFLP